MPGLVGVVSRRSPDLCQRLVRLMLDAIKHEPAWASGMHAAPAVGVYVGWVAHERSFSQRQSESSVGDNLVLSLSGECFAPPVRTGAPHPRVASRERSLCNQYRACGDRFIEDLNGLFAGVLIDLERRRALLFNDRYGSERIYIFESEDTTYFASEAKALLRIIPELRELDDKGVTEFLCFGSVLHDRTLFRNLRLLPGGSLWTCEHGEVISKHRYFDQDTWVSQTTLSEAAFDAAFCERFTSVLPGYLESNSAIGISLTGGLDTRMIVAQLACIGIEPVCYTFAGLAGETLDVRLAGRIARACGLDHRTLRIGADFVANYPDYVDRTVFVTDGCSGALGAHEIYLNGLAKQLAPIRLTGNFGSEVLRGVSTLKPLGLTEALLDPGVHRGLAQCAEEESRRLVHPVARAAFEEIPWHLSGALSAGRSQLTFRTPYLDNQLVQLAFQAPVRSLKSSASALKLIGKCSPALSTIPTDRGLTLNQYGPSAVARRLYCEATFKLDYLDKEGLPAWLGKLDPAIAFLSRVGVTGLHKFLPYRKWFRTEFAPYTREVLTDGRTRRMPHWNGTFLSSMIADHESGRKNYLREIHAVLTLEAVDRLLVRASTDVCPVSLG